MKYGMPLLLLTVLAASLALPQSNTTTSNTTTKKGQTAVSGKAVSGKAVSGKAVSGKAVSGKAVSGKAVSSNASPGASAAKKASSSKGAVPSKKGKPAKKPVAAAWRQTTPTPDRYREIQQALADKGYLKSEPNGVWDDQSADALRQFQTDRNLSPTGKLSSASLIGLGLGPKTSAAVIPPPTTSVNPPETVPAAKPEN